MPRRAPLPWIAAATLAALAASACTLDPSGTNPGSPAGAGAGDPTGTGGAGANGSGGAGTTGGGGSGAAGGGGAGGGTAACPTGRGPDMVAVPDPEGGSYCVDSTEVTNQHYKAWLDMNPMPGSRDVLCEWNTSYLPKAGFDCNGSEYDPVARADHPVVCIDWCDARDFCAWANKRLCGRIGGGPLPYNDFANATQSQWFRACSEAGARAYPYGESFAPALCVDDAYDGLNNDGNGQAEPVLLATGCEGGYPGLFGLSGNVWEWEDACSGGGPPQNHNCRWRGGSYWDGLESWLRCDHGFYGARSIYNENTGFRCCADFP